MFNVSSYLPFSLKMMLCVNVPCVGYIGADAQMNLPAYRSVHSYTEVNSTLQYVILRCMTVMPTDDGKDSTHVGRYGMVTARQLKLQPTHAANVTNC